MSRICLGPGEGEKCGRIFKPVSKRIYRCPRCEPVFRRRSNRKQHATRKARGRRTGSTAAHRKLRAKLLATDPLCHWGCGRKATTIDHLVPVSKGGADTEENCVPSCGSCNYGRTPH